MEMDELENVIELLNSVSVNQHKYFDHNDPMLERMEGITSILIDEGYRIRFTVSGNVVDGYKLRTPYLDVYHPATGGCWYTVNDGSPTVVIAAVLVGKKIDLYVPLEDVTNIEVYKGDVLIGPFSNVVISNYAQQYADIFHSVKLSVKEHKLEAVKNTSNKVTQLFPTKR